MANRQAKAEHSEIVQRFAARLREVRLYRGMTQWELAREARVTLSYIGRLENGGSAPGIDLVDRLARALGTSISDLVLDDVSPESSDALTERARRSFEALVDGADRETLSILNPLLARLRAGQERELGLPLSAPSA